MGLEHHRGAVREHRPNAAVLHGGVEHAAAEPGRAVQQTELPGAAVDGRHQHHRIPEQRPPVAEQRADRLRERRRLTHERRPLGRRRQEQLAHDAPLVPDRRAREACGRRIGGGEEVGEAEAVAQREAAGDAAAVPADAAGLVEQQVRQGTAREDRLRAFAPLEVVEQRIVLGEDQRHAADPGTLQDAIGDRGVQASGGAAGADARRQGDGGVDVGGGVHRLQRDVAAERLPGQHDLAVAGLFQRRRFLQRALHRAIERVVALGSVVTLEHDHLPAAGLEQPERRWRRRHPRLGAAGDPVVPDDDAVRALGAMARQVAERPLEPEEAVARLLVAGESVGLGGGPRRAEDDQGHREERRAPDARHRRVEHR